ncbi:MAG TPA: hypothetical protein VMB71_12320 [Acetobacteraceae bacterium]|nr:hypothetical protein [Acetobacteraceae bacterium]
MQEFQVAPLRPAEARLVYPLVQASEPAVTLESWLAFVRRITHRRADRVGIMAATRAGQRFPCGIFCYRCHEDLALGPVVTADYFVAVDILDPKPVVRAMVRELESLGERLQCQAVRSVIHANEDEVATCLRRSAHQVATTNFVKLLGHPAACAAASPIPPRSPASSPGSSGASKAISSRSSARG